MFKNLYDAVTNSVDAWQYFGIGAAMLVLLLFVAKAYFSIYPPKNLDTTPKKEIKEYICKDIQKWLATEKRTLPYWADYKKICEVSFGREKKCLIILTSRGITVSILSKFINYAINNKYDLFITLTENKFELDTEVSNFRRKNKIKNNVKPVFYNYNSREFHVDRITQFFKVEKPNLVTIYEFNHFLIERQLR
jgi:hypothetical protein